MITEASAAPIKDLVQQARSAIILLSANPTYDVVASGLALYLSLRQAGKEVQIASVADMRVEFTHLVGVDQIAKKVGNRNLVISFQYVESAVDKVSYSISEDSQQFNLVISPKTGSKPLDTNNVQFSYTGAEADVVFLVGAQSMQDLAEVYEAEKQFFDSAYTVAVTPYPVQPFARLHLDSSGQTSMAEGIARLLIDLSMEPREDIATNILSAIELNSNRFQSLAMTADSFELVGRLLRNGARRSNQNPAFSPASPVAQTFVPPTAVTETITVPAVSTQVPPSVSSTPAFANVLKVRQALQNSQPMNTMPTNLVPSLPPVPGVSTPPIVQLQRQSTNVQTPPQEWLEPKVFTGSTQV